MVHSGFLGAYDSIKTKLFRIVDQVTASRSAEDPWVVFVTGHSLGGALATLAAYDVSRRK
jgi:alpha-beta hydrolase superfamily lysophospholipase